MKRTMSYIANTLGWTMLLFSIVPLVTIIPPIFAVIYFGLGLWDRIELGWFFAALLGGALTSLGIGMGLIHTGRVLRRTQFSPGYCHRCGYDLRGRLDTPVCPECGASLR